MNFIWDNEELLEKGYSLLINFLVYKMKINNIDKLEEILSNSESIIIDIKKLIKKSNTKTLNTKTLNPKTLNTKTFIKSPISRYSPWVIKNNDPEYLGWSIFDAYDIEYFAKHEQKFILNNVNTFKYSILPDITYYLLFNIKNTFLNFQYLNIENIDTDLTNGISQLLELNSNNCIKMTSDNCINSILNKKFSLITIFMTASHIDNIDLLFHAISKMCIYGGYLLIKEYDLPYNQRDKAFLYDTFYNLYRILYDEISIDSIYTTKNTSNYKTRHEWMEYISTFGFTPIALNIPNDSNNFYNPFYLLCRFDHFGNLTY